MKYIMILRFLAAIVFCNSCLLVQASAQSGPRNIHNYPECSNSSFDPDGDSFGWENQQTCFVTKLSDVSNYVERPNCISKTSDPDGDGWGWEEGRSCIVVDDSDGVAEPQDEKDEINSLLSVKYVTPHKIDTTKAKIEFEFSKPNPAFIRFGTTPDNLTSKGSVETRSRLLHNQTLSSLEPGTKYFYRIVSNNQESEIFSFTSKGLSEDIVTKNPVPTITSHKNGDRLKADSETFSWAAQDFDESLYNFSLSIGSQDSGKDIFDSGSVSGSEVVATNLPTDGSEIFVTLWYTSKEKTEWKSSKIRLFSQSSSISSKSDKDYFGPGLAAWSLHNVKLTNVSLGGFKVFPSKTGDLLSFKTWFKHDRLKKNRYSEGTGGHIKITLRPANPSNSGPTQDVLATTFFKPNLQNLPKGKGFDHSISFRTIKFDEPATLSAGKRYFLVMENIDRNAANNWISINGLFSKTSKGQDLAAYGIDNWNTREGTRRGEGVSWGERFKHRAVLQLNMDTNYDGKPDHYEGQIYTEAYQYLGNRPKFPITGSKRLGQTLKPKKDLSLSSLMLYYSREKGSAPLTIEIKEGNVVLESIKVSASRPPVGGSDCVTCQAWVDIKLNKNLELKAGRSYFMELSTDSSTIYATWPLKDGVSHGFDKSLAFDEGYGQVSNDSGRNWGGLKFWNSTPRNDTDLMFWFRPVK